MKAVTQIILINIVVHLVAIYLETLNLHLGNVLALHPISSDHFSVYQLITHLFSHSSNHHILSNLVILLYVGYDVEEVIGKSNLWKLFILSGIFSSGLYCLFDEPIMGASGSIFGIVAACIFFTWNNGKGSFYKYWSTMLKNIILIIFFIGEVWSAIYITGDSIGHWAHVFGFICGSIFSINFIQQKSIFDRS